METFHAESIRLVILKFMSPRDVTYGFGVQDSNPQHLSVAGQTSLPTALFYVSLDSPFYVSLGMLFIGPVVTLNDVMEVRS